MAEKQYVSAPIAFPVGLIGQSRNLWVQSKDDFIVPLGILLDTSHRTVLTYFTLQPEVMSAYKCIIQLLQWRSYFVNTNHLCKSRLCKNSKKTGGRRSIMGATNNMWQMVNARDCWKKCWSFTHKRRFETVFQLRLPGKLNKFVVVAVENC